MRPKYYTIKNFAAKNKASGTWPDSEHAIRALRNDSKKNGFFDAFVTMGRRVLIDEDKFLESIENLQRNKPGRPRL